MELLSEGRRGRVYTFYKHGRKLVKKEAIDESKKGAINKEIQILKKLNKENIKFVPYIENYGDGWFEYRYVDGRYFYKYFETYGDIEIVMKFLEKVYCLDKNCVYHGELNRPTKNIIVTEGKDLFILDFERGRVLEKGGKNLIDFSQWLMRNGFLSKELVISLGNISDLSDLYLIIKNNINLGKG